MSSWACVALSVLLVSVSATRAADDLLDPSAVTGTRRSLTPTAPNGLIDAGELRGNGANPRPVPQRSTDYPRGMAATVVSSLAGLTRSYTNLCDTVSKLGPAIMEMDTKREKLIAAKAAEMADYRAGLFCSGCNRTKTDILAKGERFPHEGQQIVRPTAEQIAAKERDLQAPIDRLEKELRDARAKKEKSDKEREEAELQIRHGYRLWKTAVLFEAMLFNQGEREMDTTYKNSLTTAEGQIVKLQKEIDKADRDFETALGSRKNEVFRLKGLIKQAQEAHEPERKDLEENIASLRAALEKGGLTATNRQNLEEKLSELAGLLAQSVSTFKAGQAEYETQLAKLQGDLKPAFERLRAELTQDQKLWTDKANSLRKKYTEDVQLFKGRYESSCAALKKEQSQLRGYIDSSSPMRAVPEIPVIPYTDFNVPYQAHFMFETMGGFYRMGDYQPQRHNEVLPNVQSFIDAFHASRRLDNIVEEKVVRSTPPAGNPVDPMIKDRLRALFEGPLKANK